jgi:hypothetical protein
MNRVRGLKYLGAVLTWQLSWQVKIQTLVLPAEHRIPKDTTGMNVKRDPMPVIRA